MPTYLDDNSASVDRSTNRWAVKLVEAAGILPVSRAEAKAYARILQDDENDVIDSLLAAATQAATNVCERQLITATWRLTLDRWPSVRPANPFARISLPFPPLQDEVEIKYDDPDNVEQTLDESAYRILTDQEPGEIEVIDSWPTLRSGGGAVRIEYDAGYGDAAEDVPADIRLAIKWLACWWFENRELQTIPDAFRVMLEPYHPEETFVGIYD